MDNTGSQNHSNHCPLLDDLLYRCYRNSGRLLPLFCPFPVSSESTLVQAQHFLSVFCLSTTLKNFARTSYIFSNSEIGPRTFALWFVLLISLHSIPRRQIENIAEYLTSRSQTISSNCLIESFPYLLHIPFKEMNCHKIASCLQK